MLYNELIKIMNEDTLVSLYDNRNNISRFIFGKLLFVNEDFFIIQLFSSTGHLDGLLLKRIDEVFRIEINSSYHKKIMKLIELNNARTEKIDFCDSKPIESFLEFAKYNNHVVSVEILGGDSFNLIGFIESNHDNICKIQQIDEYGYFDGLSVFNITDVTEISCNSSSEIVIKNLYTYNLKQE